MYQPVKCIHAEIFVQLTKTSIYIVQHHIGEFENQHSACHKLRHR